MAIGDCCWLDEAASQRLTEDIVVSGEDQQWAPTAERARLRKRHRRPWRYDRIRHPRKPVLVGNNVGLWHADYVGVNGYDENDRG